MLGNLNWHDSESDDMGWRNGIEGVSSEQRRDLAKNERISGEGKMREFRSSVIYYQGRRMKACLSR